jgi:D-apiose dehydrogenase
MTLRVAIAGAGAISQYHFAGWLATPHAQLVAVCDTDLARAHAKAKTFGIPAVYADFAQMLEREKPDAVDIITPVESHARLTRIAADHGVHVCCQKPVTPTVAEAEALIQDVCDRVRFMVHENYRYRPHYVEIKRWLDQGTIGAPLQVRMTVRSQGMISVNGEAAFLLNRQPYLKNFKRLLFFEVLIHHLDILRVLLGLLSVRHCSISRINAELTGEDAGVAVLRSASGVDVVLDGNISCPGSGPLPVDRLEIAGTTGTLLFDRDRLSLLGSSTPPMQFDLVKNYQICFTRSIEDFAAGLLSGQPFQTDRLDNLETLRLMESCSARAAMPDG